MIRAAIACALIVLASCGRPEAPQPVVGTLELDRVELIAESSDPILRFGAAEGDRIESGAIVVVLDTSLLRARIDQAEAAIAHAEALRDEVKRGPRHELIAEARARLMTAERALSTARADLVRFEKLAAEGAESAQRLDAARQARDAAEGRRDELFQALAALRRGSTEEQIRAADAAVEESRRARDELHVRAERNIVRAPTAGRIEVIPFDRGERPPAGGVVAILLIEGSAYARVYIPESLRAGIEPGAPVSIHADGVPSPYRGRVRRIAHDPAFTPYFALTERDRGRLSYLAEIEILDAKDRIAAGLPVQVSFEKTSPAPR